MSSDSTIQDILKKIDREKGLINGANAMRASTTNEAVRSRLDTQIRDGQRNLEFFQNKLHDIQLRKLGQGVNDMNIRGPTNGDNPPPPPPKANRGDPNAYPPPGPGASGAPKNRAHYTKLGMHHLCQLTPASSERICRPRC